jgi:hypothetical protein
MGESTVSGSILDIDEYNTRNIDGCFYAAPVYSCV